MSGFVSVAAASPVSVSAPVPSVVARLACGAGASFGCVRPSVRSFSGWCFVAFFSSGAAAGSFAVLAARRFGFPFCAVRRAGAWFAVSVPCSVGSVPSCAGALPCLFVSFVPSVFSGVVSVGFSGGRSLGAGGAAALAALLPSVPRAGVRLSVGCAAGADWLVRSACVGSPSLLVFSVASGWFGRGRSAFARRSSRFVRSVARGSRGLVVVVPSAPCPAGVVPSRSFRGGGSGSWGSAALALGLGRRVLLWLPSASLLPSWSGVSWSSVGSLGAPRGGWFLGVPVASAVQLRLF